MVVVTDGDAHGDGLVDYQHAVLWTRVLPDAFGQVRFQSIAQHLAHVAFSLKGLVVQVVPEH